MRFAPVLFAIGCGLASTACLRTTEFRCASVGDCGPGGTCQLGVGFCSFVDGSCDSSQRYSDSAGSLANQCVAGDVVVDAGVDSPPIDGPAIDAPPPDTSSVGCPGNYIAIAGGQTGHLYRLITATDNWTSQRSFCTSTTTAAYLAIPDTTAELAALTTLAAATQFWIGISDLQDEGVWRTTKNDAPALFDGVAVTNAVGPWAAGAPDDAGPGEDCVEVVAGPPTQWNDERCNQTQLRAICECEP